MRGLIWFRNDLRVRDNPTLLAATQECDALACVYCMDARWQQQDRFGARPLGSYRKQFLQESLSSLQSELEGLGLTLRVLSGDPAEQIVAVADSLQVETLYLSRPAGTYERNDLARVITARRDLRVRSLDSATIFTRDQIDPLRESFPETFSKFRRQVKSLPVRTPVECTHSRTDGLVVPGGTGPHEPSAHRVEIEFCGGETPAHRHLEDYFSSGRASSYKETRNALDEASASTRFSPWLALGCLSPVQVLHSLRAYESSCGANDSTDWIWFELLWREFFQWYEEVHGPRLFAFEGISGVRPRTSYYAQRYRAWRDGRTPWPLVNACMHRLNRTGYLSNRGRQIVASCLVNELQLDWRCGASWFEQQLVDYDVASNWGNWQYIAGVGADPRGGRHFNLEKQARDFDPDGAFVARWGGAVDVPIALDTVDAADWPIAANASSERGGV